ncbi:MAG: hypothetical protein NDF52_03135 [archaeon YNP-WB-062]|nr:hypothetical protein [Candidatus Culexarchaeum yellowstonense]
MILVVSIFRYFVMVLIWRIWKFTATGEMEKLEKVLCSFKLL